MHFRVLAILRIPFYLTTLDTGKMELQVQFLEEVVGPVVVSQVQFLERASQETVSLSVRKVE